MNDMSHVNLLGSLGSTVMSNGIVVAAETEDATLIAFQQSATAVKVVSFTSRAQQGDVGRYMTEIIFPEDIVLLQFGVCYYRNQQQSASSSALVLLAVTAFRRCWAYNISRLFNGSTPDVIRGTLGSGIMIPVAIKGSAWLQLAALLVWDFLSRQHGTTLIAAASNDNFPFTAIDLSRLHQECCHPCGQLATLPGIVCTAGALPENVCAAGVLALTAFNSNVGVAAPARFEAQQTVHESSESFPSNYVAGVLVVCTALDEISTFWFGANAQPDIPWPALLAVVQGTEIQFVQLPCATIPQLPCATIPHKRAVLHAFSGRVESKLADGLVSVTVRGIESRPEGRLIQRESVSLHTINFPMEVIFLRGEIEGFACSRRSPCAVIYCCSGRILSFDVRDVLERATCFSNKTASDQPYLVRTISLQSLGVGVHQLRDATCLSIAQVYQPNAKLGARMVILVSGEAYLASLDSIASASSMQANLGGEKYSTLASTKMELDRSLNVLASLHDKYDDVLRVTADFERAITEVTTAVALIGFGKNVPSGLHCTLRTVGCMRKPHTDDSFLVLEITLLNTSALVMNESSWGLLVSNMSEQTTSAPTANTNVFVKLPLIGPGRKWSHMFHLPAPVVFESWVVISLAFLGSHQGSVSRKTPPPPPLARLYCAKLDCLDVLKSSATDEDDASLPRHRISLRFAVPKAIFGLHPDPGNILSTLLPPLRSSLRPPLRPYESINMHAALSPIADVHSSPPSQAAIVGRLPRGNSQHGHVATLAVGRAHGLSSFTASSSRHALLEATSTSANFSHLLILHAGLLRRMNALQSSVQRSDIALDGVALSDGETLMIPSLASATAPGPDASSLRRIIARLAEVKALAERLRKQTNAVGATGSFVDRGTVIVEFQRMMNELRMVTSDLTFSLS